MGGRLWLAMLLGAVVALTCAAPASADLDGLLASCTAKTAGDASLPYTFCDDGVPAFGGATPNLTGAQAIKVPADYGSGSDRIAGLPAKDNSATVTGQDPTDHTVALDVDISLPDPVKFPRADHKYPVVVLMHGCCSGNKTNWEASSIDGGGNENWHYNNAWFAARGYIVVTYTARGFVDGSNHGSTGETQLDSARYEINDYQSLVGQLVDKGNLGGADEVRVDPDHVVATGGSYGGGFSWLALTDPTWDSPGGTPIKLAAAAPKFGWTNLAESLVPRGDDKRDAITATDPAAARTLASTKPGFPKRTIVAALYATGQNLSGAHTTFPPGLTSAFACLQSTDPFTSNPLCSTTLSTEIPRFIDERSAYYQQSFFDRLQANTLAPVPVFSAGTFTDQLFPGAEHRRMVERLKSIVPGYPVQEYYGDYNHFVQDKRKEWADVCGSDHHVCSYTDYPASGPGRDLNADPPTRSLEPGVTTRLNRFIDHYAVPPGDDSQPAPTQDVTGALQVCPQNAADLGRKPDEPGPRFTAPTFAALAPHSLVVTAAGTQATSNPAADPHATAADPVGNLVSNGGKCPVVSSPGGVSTAGPGVASYDSPTLKSAYTMLGATRVALQYRATGPVNQIEARLYDLYPDGDQVLVDRGMRKIDTPGTGSTFDLHGAGWRFEPGHRVRVEITQHDDPYIKASTVPSALTISSARLDIPVREASDSVGGAASPRPGGGSGSGSTAASAPVATLRAPRLASDQGTTRRFRMRVRLARGSVKASHFQVDGRDTRSKRARRLTSNLRTSLLRFRGKLGHTYRFRARAVGADGKAGKWTKAAVTVVPLDAKRSALRLRGSWKRARSSRAWGHGLLRSRTRGARASIRVRGSRIYVIGRRTRRGGAARVLLNGRRRSITFRARRTQNRHVVAVLRGRSRGVNRLRITVTRGPVELDAIGPRR